MQFVKNSEQAKLSYIDALNAIISGPDFKLISGKNVKDSSNNNLITGAGEIAHSNFTLSSGKALKNSSGSTVISDSGAIGLSYLGTGTPTNSNFLRGDGVWTTPTATVNGPQNFYLS